MKKGIRDKLLVLGLATLAIATNVFADTNFSIDRTINDVKAYMKNFVISDNGLANGVAKVQLSGSEQTIKIGNTIIDGVNGKAGIGSINPSQTLTIRNSLETNIPSGTGGSLRLGDGNIDIIENNNILNILSNKNIFSGDMSIYTDPNVSLDSQNNSPKLQINQNGVKIDTHTKFNNSLTINGAANGSIDIKPGAIKDKMVKTPDLDFNSINTNNLATNVVDINKIATYQVDTNALDNESITKDKIGPAQIDSDIIGYGEIISDHLKDQQITTNEIAQGTIGVQDIDTSQVQAKIQPCPADDSRAGGLQALQVVNQDGSVSCIPKRRFSATSVGNPNSGNPNSGNPNSGNPNSGNPSNGDTCNLQGKKLDSSLTLVAIPNSTSLGFFSSLFPPKPTHIDQNGKQYIKFDSSIANKCIKQNIGIFGITTSEGAVYEKNCFCILPYTNTPADNPQNGGHHKAEITFKVSTDEQNGSVSGKSTFTASLQNLRNGISASANISSYTNAGWFGGIQTVMSYNLTIVDNGKTTQRAGTIKPQYVAGGFMGRFGSRRITPFNESIIFIPANAKNVTTTPVLLSSSWPSQLWSNSLDTNGTRYMAGNAIYGLVTNSIYVALEGALLNTDWSWHGGHNDSTFTTTIEYDVP